MRKLRGTAWGAALLILCLGWGMRVTAEEEPVEEKTIVFSVTDEGGQFTADPDQPAVWEFPLIPAGQTHRAGRLTLRNGSEATVHLKLEEIVLPYGDQAALAYLDALLITITEGEETLYNGPYSRIADSGGLKLEMENWAPGDTRELSIALRCPFSYTGNPAEVSEEITWVFSAFAPGGLTSSSDASTVRPPADEGLDITKIAVVSGAVLLLVLCMALGVVSFVRKWKKQG